MTQKNTHLIHKEKSAEQFIVDTCAKYPNEVSIITLGPLTNIAKALLLQPDLKNNIQHIYSMGGAFLIPGNVSSVAEANIHNDPEAAKIVFTSGIPITLAPLDVTHQVHLDSPFRNKIQTFGTIGKFIHDITQHYINKIVSWGSELEKLPVHDSSAVMALVRPQVFLERKRVAVDVEVRGLTVGQTVGDWGKEGNVSVLLGVDQAMFKEYYLVQLEKISVKVM